MIQSIQKIVKVGSSDGITLPAKELKRENLQRGDEVEIIVRPVRQAISKSDQVVIESARQILTQYKKDFQNLADR